MKKIIIFLSLIINVFGWSRYVDSNETRSITYTYGTAIDMFNLNIMKDGTQSLLIASETNIWSLSDPYVIITGVNGDIPVILDETSMTSKTKRTVTFSMSQETFERVIELLSRCDATGEDATIIYHRNGSDSYIKVVCAGFFDEYSKLLIMKRR